MYDIVENILMQLNGVDIIHVAEMYNEIEEKLKKFKETELIGGRLILYFEEGKILEGNIDKSGVEVPPNYFKIRTGENEFKVIPLLHLYKLL